MNNKQNQFLNNLKSNKKKITLFESFSGIGAQLEALKNVSHDLNLKTKSLGAIEWFIDAIAAFQIFHFKKKNINSYSEDEIKNKLSKFIFSTNSKTPNPLFNKKINNKKYEKLLPYIYDFVSKKNNYTCISQCKKIPKNIDIFTYSFPCQDISSQGKCKGLKKGTKSSLIYEIERILKMNKKHLPKVLIMENVNFLVSKKFINDFQDWIIRLEKLGYKNSFKVLNSADFGSAQNRKRVFLISWIDKTKEFEWPKYTKQSKIIKKIIQKNQNDFESLKHLNLYEKSNFRTTKNYIIKSNLINYTTFDSENQIFSILGKGPTLTSTGANSRIKVFFPKFNKIRQLSALECGLYTGFKKLKIIKLQKNSYFKDKKIIFLFGNSIPIELLEYVFKSIIKTFFI